MQMPVLEHAYLLRSLGWAIANSFWQTGILWLLYQLITSIDKKIPALIKYHLSVTLLLTSFLWFVFTIVQNDRLLYNASIYSNKLIPQAWILSFSRFNDALPFLSIVYLVLLCFYIIKYFKNLKANRILQTAGLNKAPIDIRLFTARTALLLGIRKKVQVWLSQFVDVPTVTGFIRPVILLPAAMLSHLSIEQVEAILLHELAHVRRQDYLVNILQSVVELLMFFNPFAILLSRAAKKERENCCDDWVMNFQYGSYEYAKALLILEEQRCLHQLALSLAATNGKKKLLNRVKRLFNTQPQTNFSPFQKSKLVVLCFVLTIGLFTITPYLINKQPASSAIDVYGKTERLAEVKIDYRSKNKSPSKNILINKPLKYIANHGAVTVNHTKKWVPKIQLKNDSIVAFINEELLNPVMRVEPIITSVVEKEIKISKYLVRIEEQQSGKKQVNTYYFEFKNKDGLTGIKPLMMLNKFKATVNKASVENLKDNLKAFKKHSFPKKRVTS